MRVGIVQYFNHRRLILDSISNDNNSDDNGQLAQGRQTIF